MNLLVAGCISFIVGYVHCGGSILRSRVIRLGNLHEKFWLFLLYYDWFKECFTRKIYKLAFHISSRKFKFPRVVSIFLLDCKRKNCFLIICNKNKIGFNRFAIAQKMFILRNFFDEKNIEIFSLTLGYKPRSNWTRTWKCYIFYCYKMHKLLKIISSISCNLSLW